MPYSAADINLTNDKLNTVKGWIRLQKSLICTACHRDIQWLPKPFFIEMTPSLDFSVISAATYENSIRKAMIAFKYHEDLSALPLLVHAIQQLPRPHGYYANNSCILPIPTTNKRLQNRGFDPVFVLAKYLAQHWQIPLWQGAERVHDLGRQQGLSKEERLLNVQGAFALIQTPNVKRIILFDDVATTGASLKALAQPFIQLDRKVELLAYTLAHGNR